MYVSMGGPEETNSQNKIESECAEFKILAIINVIDNLLVQVPTLNY